LGFAPPVWLAWEDWSLAIAFNRAFICALLVLFAGCASLPRHVERIPSVAIDGATDTNLKRALATALAANPGKTGVHLLESGREAFAARMLLARVADRSLDVQYYLWRDDTTGRLLIKELWQAAERGVRVRLLLDDNNMKGLDATLATLDAHPHIEVRLFNPYANRGVRVGEMVGDFSRINRRMHNKSFTADNKATIVGGRNVGDEYFGAGTPIEFADLDVLVAGSAVRETSESFDAYWNSESAYPVTALIPAATRGDAARMQEALVHLETNPAAAQYLEAVQKTGLMRELLAGHLPLVWAPGHIVADDPVKVLQPPEQTEAHMLPQLTRAIGKPERELDLVSPYFIPTKTGAAALAALAQRGVKVRVLTNSLAATDVLPVHAGYVKYREPLLRAGVRIFEMKPRGERPRRGRRTFGSGGSSAESLHAKTFVADRERLFVGSFNFDPRSISLNTEMGLMLESPVLASQVSQSLDANIADMAYEVRLTPEGLEWVEGDKRYRSEPGATVMQRFMTTVLSVLPIEWML
jgi:putative cardiolipin synthase